MKAHARAVLEVLEQYENGRVRTKDYGARKANGVRDYIAHVKAAGFELRAWMRRKIAELESRDCRDDDDELTLLRLGGLGIGIDFGGGIGA